MKQGLKHIEKAIAACLAQNIAGWQHASYIIGISGGPDSVLLARLMHYMQLNIALAHVNYNLRGEESKADEKFVRALGKQLNIPVYVKNVNTTALKTRGQSVQMLARDIRYTFFSEMQRKHQHPYLVLAHQAGDQAETLLLNLFRGCGLNGLTGMKTFDRNILRPLLAVSKEAILNVLQQQKWDYRTDASNAKNDYKRNFLRNTIIPQLETKWPGLQKTLLENIGRFTSARQALGGSHASMYRFSFGHNDAVDMVQLQSPAALDQFKKDCVKHGFNLRTLNAFFTRKAGAETRTLQGKTSSFVQKGNEFRFICNPGTGTKPKLKVGKHTISITGIDTVFLRQLTETIAAGSIKGKLSLRKWVPGDKMKPLGMNGFKKISDMLTGYKLDLAQKAQVYILCDEEKTIWLAGLRLDNRVRLNGDEPGGAKIRLVVR